MIRNTYARHALTVIGSACIVIIGLLLASLLGPWGTNASTSGLESAGIGSWQQVGLAGQSVRSLVSAPGNPQLIYAGVDGQGVYSSADGGRNWAALSTVGLVNRTVQSVAACPSGALFAGTWGGGVFRYAGTSWIQVNQGLTEGYISALLCSPQGILLAGTNSKGVFRSANAGSNWTPANAGLTDLRILTLQSRGDTTFVGTRTGAFESKDGGVTWNATGLSGVSVYDFDFDPTSASRFWAATIPQGIQVTSDGGATWAGMGSALQAYAVALDVSNVIHAGTKDSGVLPL